MDSWKIREKEQMPQHLRRPALKKAPSDEGAVTEGDWGREAI